MSYSKQVPAVERALNLLETLVSSPNGLTAGELIDQLGVSRSTLFALLNTLKARDYIEQQDDRGPYRLGPALWNLIAGRQQDLTGLIEAFQHDAEIKLIPETMALASLEGSETVIVAQIECQQRVRAVVGLGERRSVLETADGLVLLAGLSPQAIEHYSPPQASDLSSRLQQIQKYGLVQLARDETVEIACPVCADGVQPFAALLLVMPAYRAKPDYLEPLVKRLQQLAARLSYRLGAAVYQPYGWAVGEPIGPTVPLGLAELKQFLSGAWGARLACVRRDGTPHVIPLWYEWDGRFIWITASPGAYWKSYVREASQVSLTIDEPWPPLRRALITGRAEPVADEQIKGGLAGLRNRLLARYLGQGAQTGPALNQLDQWQAFRILPGQIKGYRGLGC